MPCIVLQGCCCPGCSWSDMTGLRKLAASALAMVQRACLAWCRVNIIGTCLCLACSTVSSHYGTGSVHESSVAGMDVCSIHAISIAWQAKGYLLPSEIVYLGAADGVDDRPDSQWDLVRWEAAMLLREQRDLEVQAATGSLALLEPLPPEPAPETESFVPPPYEPPL